MPFESLRRFAGFSRRQFLCLSGGIIGLAVPTTAFADQPRSRPAGKIAFVSGDFGDQRRRKIWIISADGLDFWKLTDDDDDPREDSPAWSPDGRRIAFSAMRDGTRRIYVRDSDGKNETSLIPATMLAGDCGHPSWSPDGKIIVFSAFETERKSAHIRVVSVDGTNLRQLTSGDSYNWIPCFSPDGQHIVFESTRDGNREIYQIAADGSNPINLSKHPQTDHHPAYAPDGRRIAFMSRRNRESANIYLMNSDGSNPVNLTKHPGRDSEPVWSPCGGWIAFTRIQGADPGPMHICIIRADGTGCVSLTEGLSNADHWGPSWGPD